MRDEQAPLDVGELIDRLDDLVRGAARVPLTDQVRVSRDELRVILDELWAALPGEIAQAHAIVRERAELQAAARREAEGVLADAAARAAYERSEATIASIASRDGAAIVAQARRQAHEVERAVDEWADSILTDLETNLERFLGAVRRGRERLHERSSRESALPGESGSRPIGRETAPDCGEQGVGA